MFYLILFGGIVLLCVVVYQLCSSKHIMVDKYEYLDLLSLHTWKEGRELQLEMEKKKGGDVSIPGFYACMHQLEADGLVERRDGVAKSEERRKIRGFSKVLEFRLTQNGSRKRSELDSGGTLKIFAH